MSTRKIIGIILLIGGIALGINGFNQVAGSDASIEVLDVDIDISNKSGKNQGYLQLGLAIILFGGGLYTLNKKQ